MANHNELGKLGEQKARHYLSTHGFAIRESNWRHGHLEIDIIAETPHEIVFVEVKTRQSALYGEPEQAVDKEKMQAYLKAANYYVRTSNINKPVRFDTMGIIINSHECMVRHIPDAFNSLDAFGKYSKILK
ncbi:MAG: YraN family protein [Bacteroidales bacterium]|nr:YraN family protein [Bacteroidales bacterium]